MYKPYNTFRIMCISFLKHEGRVTHICVSKLLIIVSEYGLSPGRRLPIIWANAGILLRWPLGTKFCEIFIEINISSFEKNTFESVCEISTTLPRPWIKCFIHTQGSQALLRWCYFKDLRDKRLQKLEQTKKSQGVSWEWTPACANEIPLMGILD